MDLNPGCLSPNTHNLKDISPAVSESKDLCPLAAFKIYSLIISSPTLDNVFFVFNPEKVWISKSESFLNLWLLFFSLSFDKYQSLIIVSVAKSSLNLCDPVNCSTPGITVLCLLEFAQIHIHWVSDAIQLPHPLLPSSPPDLNISQQQVAIVLELQYQWIFRVDFL